MSQEDQASLSVAQEPPVGAWWLVFAFVLVTAAAVFWAIPHEQDDLTARSQQAVAAAGFRSVDVEFEGRDATLRGTVARPADRDSLEDLVLRIEGVRTVEVADIVIEPEADGGDG